MLLWACAGGGEALFLAVDFFAEVAGGAFGASGAVACAEAGFGAIFFDALVGGAAALEVIFAGLAEAEVDLDAGFAFGLAQLAVGACDVFAAVALACADAGDAEPSFVVLYGAYHEGVGALFGGGTFGGAEFVVGAGELEASFVGQGAFAAGEAVGAEGDACFEFGALAVLVVTDVSILADIAGAAVGVCALAEFADLACGAGGLWALVGDALFVLAFPFVGAWLSGAACEGFGDAGLDVTEAVADLALCTLAFVFAGSGADGLVVLPSDADEAVFTGGGVTVFAFAFAVVAWDADAGVGVEEFADGAGATDGAVGVTGFAAEALSDVAVAQEAFVTGLLVGAFFADFAWGEGDTGAGVAFGFGCGAIFVTAASVGGGACLFEAFGFVWVGAVVVFGARFGGALVVFADVAFGAVVVLAAAVLLLFLGAGGGDACAVLAFVLIAAIVIFGAVDGGALLILAALCACAVAVLGALGGGGFGACEEEQ